MRRDETTVPIWKKHDPLVMEEELLRLLGGNMGMTILTPLSIGAKRVIMGGGSLESSIVISFLDVFEHCGVGNSVEIMSSF